eukprot:365358-Chlamydomonas_euryale.AAC.7
MSEGGMFWCSLTFQKIHALLACPPVEQLQQPSLPPQTSATAMTRMPLNDQQANKTKSKASQLQPQKATFLTHAGVRGHHGHCRQHWPRYAEEHRGKEL